MRIRSMKTDSLLMLIIMIIPSSLALSTFVTTLVPDQNVFAICTEITDPKVVCNG